MVVDDSAVIRGLVSRWLREDPDIEVVYSAINGAVAVRNVKSCNAEVVILDIEMPEMDGMTALPKLVTAVPDIKVIMASTLTRRGAKISIEAMAKGAADYVPKPELARDGDAAAVFRRDIIAKIKALGAATRSRRARRASGGIPAPAPVSTRRAGAIQPVRPSFYGTAPIKLRAPAQSRHRILAVGSSTGGPQALLTLFDGLKGKVSGLPVVITQHMPATFTAILAEHITKQTGLPCAEARDGETLKNGQLYIAPGGHHLLVEKQGAAAVIRINDGPAENFCRPSVDPMFRSLAQVFGAGVLGIILTGMGHDGRDGGKVVVDAGGTLLAQDEDTSVVWGMPGAVATEGLCSAVLPLTHIAPAAAKLIAGGGL